jgi:hypothetical protein
MDFDLPDHVDINTSTNQTSDSDFDQSNHTFIDYYGLLKSDCPHPNPVKEKKIELGILGVGLPSPQSRKRKKLKSWAFSGVVGSKRESGRSGTEAVGRAGMRTSDQER